MTIRPVDVDGGPRRESEVPWRRRVTGPMGRAARTVEQKRWWRDDPGAILVDERQAAGRRMRSATAGGSNSAATKTSLAGADRGAGRCGAAAGSRPTTFSGRPGRQPGHCVADAWLGGPGCKELESCSTKRTRFSVGRSTSVEQKRLVALQTLLNSAPAIFRRQGAVVATWRTVVSQRTGETRRVGALLLPSLSGRRPAAGVLSGAVQRICRRSEKGVGDAASAAAAGAEDRPAPQDD